MASNDPFEKPVIRGNYLTDPMDEAVLLHGIQIALSLSNTSALAKYNMTLSNAPLPACSQHAYPSDDYWRCAIREDTGPENHQAGSCKMGPATDRMAVVDPRLRVHGIRGLRVADTSIMPRVSLIFSLLQQSVYTNESRLILRGLLFLTKGDIREHGRSSDHDRREGGSFRQVRVGWCAVKMVRACFFPCVETLKRGMDDSSH